jgi:hypothetical protein
VAVSYEHGTAPLSFIKGRELSGHLNDYQLFNDRVPWN